MDHGLSPASAVSQALLLGADAGATRWATPLRARQAPAGGGAVAAAVPAAGGQRHGVAASPEPWSV